MLGGLNTIMGETLNTGFFHKAQYEVCVQVRLKPACSATETSKSLAVSGIENERLNYPDCEQQRQKEPAWLGRRFGPLL